MKSKGCAGGKDVVVALPTGYGRTCVLDFYPGVFDMAHVLNII